MLHAIRVVLLAALVQVSTSGKDEEFQKILEHKLQNYNGRAMPSDSVTVTVNIYVRGIAIEENPEDLGTYMVLTMTYREEWIDPRLAYRNASMVVPEFIHAPSKPAQGNLFDRVWMPDTFFQNDVDAAPLDRSKWDRMCRVYHDGSILVSARVKHRFECPIYHGIYPFGTHKCSLELASYGSTENILRYEWKVSDSKPIAMKDGLRKGIHGYELENIESTAQTYLTTTGMYGSLVASFTLRRLNVQRDIMELFLSPGSMVVASLVAFVVPEWKTQGIGFVVLLLGLYNVMLPITLANHPLVRLSYTHTWMVGCLGFLVAETLALLFLLLIAKCTSKKPTTKSVELVETTTAPDTTKLESVPLDQENGPGQQTVGGKPAPWAKTRKLVRLETLTAILPPNRDGLVVNILRIGFLVIFIVAFAAWCILASMAMDG